MSRRRIPFLGAVLVIATFIQAVPVRAEPRPIGTTPATTASVPPPAGLPGSGIQVGPPPPPTPTNTGSGGTIGGDQASHPHFWDLPGRIRKAIDDWFKGLVLDALNPMLDLVGKTVLATPQLTQDAQVAGLWQISRTRAEGADFQEWIRYDIEYVENAHWSLDLLIIWKTLGAVFRGTIQPAQLAGCGFGSLGELLDLQRIGLV